MDELKACLMSCNIRLDLNESDILFFLWCGAEAGPIIGSTPSEPWTGVAAFAFFLSLNCEIPFVRSTHHQRKRREKKESKTILATSEGDLQVFWAPAETIDSRDGLGHDLSEPMRPPADWGRDSASLYSRGGSARGEITDMEMLLESGDGREDVFGVSLPDFDGVFFFFLSFVSPSREEGDENGMSLSSPES